MLERVGQVTRRLEAELGGAFVPAALDQLHVTVFVAGFPTPTPALDDDVALEALAAMARRVERLRAGPPRLWVGGANAFLSCPFLEVHEVGADLARVRLALGEGAREIRFADYNPHVTLGAIPSAVDTAALRRCLGPLRRLPPLPLRAVALELVSFEAARAGAPLVTERSLPFSGRSPGPGRRR